MRDVSGLPVRKRLDHRGPLLVDVSSAWYFITICAEGHEVWCVDDGNGGRAARPLAAVADGLLSTARLYQKIGKWRLALFLVMPDHIHLIVHIPVGGEGSRRLPNAAGKGLPALPRWLLSFQISSTLSHGVSESAFSVISSILVCAMMRTMPRSFATFAVIQCAKVFAPLRGIGRMSLRSVARLAKNWSTDSAMLTIARTRRKGGA